MPEPAVDTLADVREALARLQRLLSSRRVWSAAAVAADVPLSQQLVQLLSVLEDGEPRSLADLARATSLDAAAVSRCMPQLEEHGFARRRPSPTHGRVVLVEATPEGKRTAARIRRIRARQLDEALAGWDEAERDELGRLLTRFVNDLSATPYRRGS